MNAFLSQKPTPHKLGYRLPAEWEPHEATWLAWPHEKTDWPGKFPPIPWVYGDIVRKLSCVERVRIMVDDSDAQLKARRVILKCGAEMKAVQFFRVPTNRSWTRDFAPIFVKSVGRKSKAEASFRTPSVGATNWRFNGWAKYENWKKD
ncbi:MAG TPA: agmatine deiminase family protein, partial [Candidatus Acidoferrales bacterium]|nr:agmatine deiminase family protein [Candidatus Acidoferrales bacterium]